MTYFNLTELQEAAAEKSGWSVFTELNPPPSVLKYNRCKTVAEIKEVNPNYREDLELIDGVYVWNYRLDALENGDELFEHWLDWRPTIPLSFNISMPNLRTGIDMFKTCEEGLNFGSGKRPTSGINLTKDSIKFIINDLMTNNSLPAGETGEIWLEMPESYWEEDSYFSEISGLASYEDGYEHDPAHTYSFNITAAGGGTWKIVYSEYSYLLEGGSND